MRWRSAPSTRKRPSPASLAAGGARSFVEVAADRQVLTVSLGTLQGIGAEELRRKLGELREAFAFVKFGDNPRARARVSPWAAAAVALDVGVEPIVHAGCRDRNRLALQSDLLGGRLLGVRNMLCLRGDEIEVSDQPEARAVHDLDVTDLIRTAAGHFCVLAAADPAAGMSEELAARLREKVAAGAQVLETQPVFDLDDFGRWRDWLAESGVEVPLLVDVAVVSHGCGGGAARAHSVRGRSAGPGRPDAARPGRGGGAGGRADRRAARARRGGRLPPLAARRRSRRGAVGGRAPLVA